MFQICVVFLFGSLFLMFYELARVGGKLYVALREGKVLASSAETHARGLSVIGLLPEDLLRIKMVLMFIQLWGVCLFVYAQIARNPQFQVVSLLLGTGLLMIAIWISIVLPDKIVEFIHEMHMVRLNRQLVDAMQVMSMALRAGKTFPESLDAVALHAPAPLCLEFNRAVQEIQMGGASLENALGRLAERLPFKDMRIFVSTMLIVQFVGGSFADSLDRSAHLIRERFRIRQKCWSLTAEGRFMALAIALAPIVNLLLYLFVNFEPTMRFILHPIGCLALVLIGILDYIGYRFIRSILQVEF